MTAACLIVKHAWLWQHIIILLLTHRKVYRFNVTILTSLWLRFIEVDRIVSSDKGRRRNVIDRHIVDVCHKVFLQIVRALAVGHNEEAMELHAFIGCGRHHNFSPLVHLKGRSSDMCHLHHRGQLISAFFALTQSSDEHTSSLWTVHPSVNVERAIRRQSDGLIQLNPSSESVRTEA